ncbi:hypothetical protein [Roseobacter sp.]|uniref:hypothetical protein n=1 Tax=Roseobacter sp. TaxID=1907202 RepID=UPI0038700D5F
MTLSRRKAISLIGGELSLPHLLLLLLFSPLARRKMHSRHGMQRVITTTRG